MRNLISKVSLVLLCAFITFSITGCTLIFQKGRKEDIQRISQLKSELSDLERAQAELRDRLKSEIDGNEVKVEMLEKGLVVTFLAEVLFDSGKAKLKADSLSKISKVSSVLQTTVRDLNVGVEGHTDNVPIKHSGWKSNWELSSARAMSVLHYLADEHGIAPDRLSATGYGEYHPIDSNDTKAGRQQNRRVEIVILPRTIKEDGEIMSENLK